MLRPNIFKDIPEWAQRKDKAFPGWKDWGDWERFVRDSVRGYCHQAPHTKPRVYDFVWEIDLRMPPFKNKPQYTAADVVELYRRTRPIVKALKALSGDLGNGL